jgi:hypothetical protein
MSSRRDRRIEKLHRDIDELHDLLRRMGEQADRQQA